MFCLGTTELAIVCSLVLLLAFAAIGFTLVVRAQRHRRLADRRRLRA